MDWMCLIVVVFSVLTLYYTREEYKRNRLPKKAFAVVSIIESVVITASAVMLIQSL